MKTKPKMAMPVKQPFHFIPSHEEELTPDDIRQGMIKVFEKYEFSAEEVLAMLKSIESITLEHMVFERARVSREELEHQATQPIATELPKEQSVVKKELPRKEKPREESYDEDSPVIEESAYI